MVPPGLLDPLRLHELECLSLSIPGHLGSFSLARINRQNSRFSHPKQIPQAKKESLSRNSEFLARVQVKQEASLWLLGGQVGDFGTTVGSQRSELIRKWYETQLHNTVKANIPAGMEMLFLSKRLILELLFLHRQQQ
ncbi:Hypothetical protein NTJ_11116 [Nesidiocoris tenuis]|uniref:Uncharacterized protein n=1 Tax=Nesidiocoris tenuis TaxID=355587 RepID=A0ABN7B1K6_9HEMI|nr:Hypothetical protein NTJ_11116 [Nesidiocoris tenuis]